MAAQLAVARGARVFGTAREESLHVIAGIPGVVPVRAGDDWGPVLRGAGTDRVDAALDARGGGVLSALIGATGSRDHVVTVADFAAAEHGVRFSRGELAGEPTGHRGLQDLAQLMASTPITVPMRGAFPFSEASRAHDAAALRPRWGKVALSNEMFSSALR